MYVLAFSLCAICYFHTNLSLCEVFTFCELLLKQRQMYKIYTKPFITIFLLISIKRATKLKSCRNIMILNSSFIHHYFCELFWNRFINTIFSACNIALFVLSHIMCDYIIFLIFPAETKSQKTFTASIYYSHIHVTCEIIRK